MTLVTTATMLRQARSGGYAVGAFNVENMEMVQAVVATADRLRAPVILQTTPGTLGYASLSMFAAMISAQAATTDVPIAIHLDHGDCFELAAAAVRAGYTSVMFDGSRRSYDENVDISQRVCQMCHAMDLPVELELGTVGGKEDTLTSTDVQYTDPDQATEFVATTKADFLAVAIGTAHGPYKGVPQLDVDRLSAIAAQVSVPLVLHGSSGLSDEAVADCVSRGIAKVNFATELRAAYLAAAREFLKADATAIDPKKMGKPARAAVSDLVAARMQVIGCVGRAC
ncbi:MAG: class II fructose-bisphosphate aldolase family protein [Propionibacteriaceae bacterium]|jgi:tagatose 1,6-diphosphate aldolase GatY/KbaY|nr:class II fructose-bisphosphate aldolase family protein [Propionibacteriaceae bacterium]